MITNIQIPHDKTNPKKLNVSKTKQLNEVLKYHFSNINYCFSKEKWK